MKRHRAVTVKRHRAVAFLGGAAILAAATTGSTYAAFSDFVEVNGNTAGAATVVVGGPESAVPQLQYLGLLPDDPITDELPVTYSGTIPADLYLDVDEDGATPFCAQGSDGLWTPLDGGALEINAGGPDWVDYCSLLDDDRVLELGDDVAPDTHHDFAVQMRLRPDTDTRYSQLADIDALTVMARQSGGTQSFTDHVVGTIEISIGQIFPQTPQECLDEFGVDYFDDSNTIVLTPGDDRYLTPKQPDHGHGYLVFGLGGNDKIIGSNQADCLVGGDGHDKLWGGNQDDVLIGGAGNDLLAGDLTDFFHHQDDDDAWNEDGDKKDEKKNLNGGQGQPHHTGGGNGKDKLYGGDGNDGLYGGNGQDELYGGNGHDWLLGGHGPDDLSGDAGGDVLYGGHSPDDVDGGDAFDVCINFEHGAPDTFDACEWFIPDMPSTLLMDAAQMAPLLQVDPDTDGLATQSQPQTAQRLQATVTPEAAAEVVEPAPAPDPQPGLDPAPTTEVVEPATPAEEPPTQTTNPSTPADPSEPGLDGGAPPASEQGAAQTTP